MHKPSHTRNDESLALLFRQMRRADARQAPAFPDEAALSQRAPLVRAHKLYRTLPAAAAALAALAVLVLLLNHEPDRLNPAEQYAAVMKASSLTTDTLLSVSRGTLPGMVGLPEMYQTETISVELQRTH